MSAAVASFESGKANAQATANNALQQMYTSEIGAYAGGPRAEVLPHLDNNLESLVQAFNNRGGYIDETAGGNALLNQAFNQVGDTSVRDATSDYLRTSNIGAGNITDYASSLINNDLLQGQIDAASRDVVRNLGENQLTGVRSADIGSGNLGSSRGGVQEAILQRGAADQIADIGASMRGAAYNNALGQAQSQLNTNNATQLAGLDTLSGMDQQNLTNLTGAGQLQRELDQAGIDNRIGARDYDATNQAQLGSLLQQYAGVGNLIDEPKKPNVEYKGKSWTKAIGGGLW